MYSRSKFALETINGTLTAVGGWEVRNICHLCVQGSTHAMMQASSCARMYRPSFRENKPNMLVFNNGKRAFGLVFAKTGSINLGTEIIQSSGNNFL